MIAAAAAPGPAPSQPLDGSRPRSQPRLAWIDAARGLGIVLVVAGHAMGGIIDSPMGTGQTALRQAFFALYTFHMPLFLVLAGLLVPDRVQRGRGAFVRGALRSVAWPYFLWSAVQFTAIFAAGSLVNRPAGAFWPVLLALPWRTVSQFWFLYALFWMHLIAVLVLPRGKAAGLLVLGIAAKLLVAVVPLDITVRLVANNLAWYALGAWLGTARLHGLLAALAVPVRALALPAGAALAGAATIALLPLLVPDRPLALASSPELASLAWRLFAIPAAVLGAGAVLGLATLPCITGAGWLVLLGQRSMAIFILHVLFVAGTRIVLLRAGLIDGALPLLAVLIVAGLAGPLLAERALRALRLGRWLGF